MSNPLFNAMQGMSGNLPGQMGQFQRMAQEFKRFKAGFNGDPWQHIGRKIFPIHLCGLAGLDANIDSVTVALISVLIYICRPSDDKQRTVFDLSFLRRFRHISVHFCRSGKKRAYAGIILRSVWKFDVHRNHRRGFSVNLFARHGYQRRNAAVNGEEYTLRDGFCPSFQRGRFWRCCRLGRVGRTRRCRRLWSIGGLRRI